MTKFTRPTAPPAPMFAGQKEFDLSKQLSQEIAERVINQPVAYYSIDFENTEYNFYGEAINKTFLPPVLVYCFLEFEGGKYDSTKVDHFGLEKNSKLLIHFPRRRLQEDLNLYVREGDFVLHSGVLFEIVSLSEPQSPFGQTLQRVEITANCIRSRKGLFNAQ